jgi:ABC-2 type transport system permease protein
MLERIRTFVIKELLQTLREKRSQLLIFAVPVIQLIMFGYVATLDVHHIPTALLDYDQSQESRELARRIASSGYFIIKDRPGSSDELGKVIDSGRALCGIQMNNGFSKDLKIGGPATIQLIVDGTDSNTAMIGMSYITAIVTRYSTELGLHKAPIVKPAAVDFRTRVWYNPDLRSRNFFIPGVIALLIMLTCLVLTSMAIVREREIGTMEQLMVTPLRPIELILGKTIPYAMVGYVDMLIVTVAAVLWFDVPIKGAFFFLFVCTTVYLLSVLGIGLFISTISRTQQQAMMATFLFFQPTILLSGFATPIENMPLGFQWLTYLSPLRYFLVIVRGIFLKGSGFDVLWPQVLALFLLGAGITIISAMRFKKRLA